MVHEREEQAEQRKAHGEKYTKGGMRSSDEMMSGSASRRVDGWVRCRCQSQSGLPSPPSRSLRTTTCGDDWLSLDQGHR